MANDVDTLPAFSTPLAECLLLINPQPPGTEAAAFLGLIHQIVALGKSRARAQP